MTEHDKEQNYFWWVLFQHKKDTFFFWLCLERGFQPILTILNGQNGLNGQFPKWWTVQSISIPNGLKQYSLFSFYLFPFQMVWNSAVYFHSIYFHSKCIVNKHPFYPFHPFGMVKTILTKYSFYPFHPFWSFLPFGMVKTILTIPNENGQNSLKCHFQTGPKNNK